ncbi:MAG: tRNA pseudouridine(38-40) synthase TruA [Oligoflexales bacterium]|nr:tRNA pseudouridine(38-40) synthase TruA [Oligoflexales bacterium]
MAKVKVDGPLYKACVAYKGTLFKGFQSQPDGNAIQDKLEEALQIFLRHPVRIRGASRTDTGVHAEHQVFTFRSPVKFRQIPWLRSLEALLPKDIGVWGVEAVDDRFNPIVDSKAKAYRYQLWLGYCFSPFLKDFVWSLPDDLDVEWIRDQARSLIGTHDFTSFCNRDSDALSKIRTVIDIHVDVERFPLISIWFLGTGFLKQMVRIMVGTLVNGAQRKPLVIDEILKKQDRCAAGQTAPAQGLSLMKIFYEEEIPTLIELSKTYDRSIKTSL